MEKVKTLTRKEMIGYLVSWANLKTDDEKHKYREKLNKKKKDELIEVFEKGKEIRFQFFNCL